LAIDLDLETGRVTSLLNDFLRLQNMNKTVTILRDYKGQLAPLMKMFDSLKKNNTRARDIRHAMDM
jgi:hypothetical protein